MFTVYHPSYLLKRYLCICIYIRTLFHSKLSEAGHPNKDYITVSSERSRI